MELRSCAFRELEVLGMERIPNARRMRRKKEKMTRVAKIRADEEVFRDGARECLPFTTIDVKASKIDGNGAV